MTQNNVPLLVLSGLLAGIILTFAVMAVAPHILTGAHSTDTAPPPVTQQIVTVGGDLRQFSTPKEALAFLRTHTEDSEQPRLLNAGPDSQGVVINGTRTWQFDVDTSSFKPDEYLVTVQAVKEIISDSALFNVLEGLARESIATPGLPQAPHVTDKSGYYLTIDAIGNRYIGEKFSITGTTNLPADTDLLVQVISSSFKPTQKSQSGEFAGIGRTVKTSSSSLPVQSVTRAPTMDPDRKYSTTNVQVNEVDEADIVKTDGTYVYLVTGNRLHIIRGYPATDAGIISTIQFSGSPQSLYLNGDRLVLISSTHRQDAVRQCQPGTCSSPIPVSQKTQVFIYSVKDAGHPTLVRELELDGTNKDSRMIGSMLYLIANKHLDINGDDGFPGIYDSSHGSQVPPVYYFDRNDREFDLTTISSVDIRAADPVRAKSFLIGSAGTIYVSTTTLYISIPADDNDHTTQSTDLYAFALDEGRLKYTARGQVEGTLLNQYSLDEYQGNLRVATTIQDSRFSTNDRHSKVTILGTNLQALGTVDNLAPGQQIYAARFMGTRLYLVTFRETDPLYVIDLASPADPTVLGELHIPGFSQYLHPYDATHLIGIGKESTWGGLKVSLFDVADVHKPSLVSEKKLGGYGSDSEVLRDAKAFLFDREKNILVLPVHIVENTPTTHGMGRVWGGVYIFGVDPDKGFFEKGTVVHYQNSNNFHHVIRAFTIEDTLYTVAMDKIVMSDLMRGVAPVGVVGLT
ncbi:beta-propeller domain-containing protein [Methanoregula sp.]|uniref:beta-propeller domain-containing protein n=1 Tax=Methanoregula sp. TaxID=2052170 RepID=UPI00356739B1